MTEIAAAEQPWNSATTLYIARKLQRLTQARGKQLSVLDMGCGDGGLIRQFAAYGHDLYGYDFPDREGALKQNLEPLFGETLSRHVRIMRDERIIPFEDDLFDVIYANQVFEHVRFLDRMLEECARVLRPGGVLVALFPLATYPLEGHAKIPFVHWLPPGRFRRRYMLPFFWMRLRPRRPGRTARESAEDWDVYLQTQTFYRFLNEVASLSEYYFEHWEFDTHEYVRARLDLLDAHPSRTRRILARVIRPLWGKLLDTLVTHYFCAVFCMSSPRK